MPTRSTLLNSAALAVAIVLTSAAAPAPALAQARNYAFDIPAGSLSDALRAFGQTTRQQLVFTESDTGGKRAGSVQGQLSGDVALDRILAGSGLVAERAPTGGIVIRGGEAGRPQPVAAVSAAADGPTTVEELVIGTYIRGGGEIASEVVSLGRTALDAGGFQTLGEALSAIPQTFGGTISDRTSGVGADSTGTNAARSTGINLRGLGADATLVLVNGRRMAGAGLMADFADIAGLPMSAVQRVDILLDGASALYGSEAVGGVVNIVMRDRFEGAETRARIGGATDGGYEQRQLSQTYGKAWATGSALLSAEYQRTGQVLARQRDFTNNVDLRAFGGIDHRPPVARPGNILNGSSVPIFAIPAGQDGTALTTASFLPGQVNYENANEQAGILPRQERISVYATASQNLGSRVTVNTELRYSDRRYAHLNFAPVTALTVSTANPYFVSPNGTTSNIIGYSFQDEAGPNRNTGSSESISLAFGAKATLPAGWRLDAYAAHAEEQARNRTAGLLNSAALNEALGNTPDNPASNYSAARDGYFNPYMGAGRNKQAVLDFVLSGWDRRRTVGKLDIASATVDGALFALPAGPVRLAIGGQLRRESLNTAGVSTANAFVPVDTFSRLGRRTVRAIFAEARAPLFGDDFTAVGLGRLEVSAAVRREDYDSGIGATTPKFGLTWSPGRDLTVRGTYGESFRAPSIGQLTDRQGASPVRLVSGGAPVVTLILTGGNPDLKPETAKSWTTGADFAPHQLPGLRVSGTYFHTVFEGRIGRPAVNYLSTVLTAPDLAPFRRLISPATNAADLALVKSYLINATAAGQAAYAPEAYGAIGDARYVNAGAFKVEGVDFTGAYQTTLGGNALALTGNASWILSYQRKVTPTSTPVELAGLATFPADFRARLSASWTRGDIGATATINHTGDLKTETNRRMPSLTTADLQLRWAPQGTEGWRRGTSAALTAQNVFNKPPPFYDSPQWVGFDAANFDPVGRVVSLQLIKSW